MKLSIDWLKEYIDIGGIPPLSHFSFDGDNPMATKAYFVQLMLERGFLASTLFYAMYAHQDEHVISYLRAVNETFSEIFTAKQKGNLDTMLKGRPASQGFKRLT